MSTFYQNWCIKKAKIKLNRLSKYYPPKCNILEVGAGNSALTLLLRQAGYEVTALDIAHKSAFSEVRPVIYDGGQFPFQDRSFDVVQLITMLHHCPNPEHLVQEAKRVGKRVIIMEDIYTNRLQKYLTFIADSINNWEFSGHPHSNKTDKAWRALFDKHTLTLQSVEYYRFLLFFKQVTYELVPYRLKP